MGVLFDKSCITIKETTAFDSTNYSCKRLNSHHSLQLLVNCRIGELLSAPIVTKKEVSKLAQIRSRVSVDYLLISKYESSKATVS